MEKSLLDRRRFLALSSATAAGLTAAPTLSRGKPERPHVLFIAVDDLNDWIGPLGGHPDVKTPNLDRLASLGITFTNAHCPAPLCNPSRAALMTGLRPSTSGIYTNEQPWRESPRLQDAVTLPQHFRAHGYRAIGGGKIYHGKFMDPASWDTYFPSQSQDRPPDPLPPGRPLNGIPNTAHFDWGPVDAADAEMADMKVAEWAAGELSRDQDGPLFLACGISKPHLPWYVPQKYFDLYPLESITLPTINENDLDDVPPAAVHMAKPNGDHRKVLEHDQWRQAVQGYLASISFADAVLGRILDAYDASPWKDNTVLVLWSDHGWHLGEKLHWRKFSLWEEATRNALMIVAPGVTTPGSRSDQAVDLMGVYPTLTELCGLPERAEIEGASLVPLLRKPDAERKRPALTTFGQGNHSIRTERWRYTRYNDGGEELYDHSDDPLEWTNLATRPEYTAIKKELAQWLPKHNAAPV
ncbi:iduronate-2-sulfatase [Streptomyces sp. WAC 06738]|uniref:sulfatase n=1 Tax=Streptomyces sp. WAC 06738 TaxID=2203210 RepID=UPI000F71603B|nr:sulfatase [Streptomyces sp. WAC 06738]AZM49593.1 iduronate-2-sulfatase [Streptomyces sp. WAC 06738]